MKTFTHLLVFILIVNKCYKIFTFIIINDIFIWQTITNVLTNDCINDLFDGKVCQMLGIIEVDYFGLQYLGHRGEMLWINMRNQIKQQMTGANNPPFRFQLKVKFFVPPHLLLQEETRYVYYIRAPIPL